MRRYTLLIWGALALSASSLLPVWLGQATAADKPAASPQGAAVKPGLPATIPEDGSGADDFPASSRLVRDILKTRPSEDLIICIAGCRPGNDRVVYAQPAEPKTAPAVAAAPAASTEPAQAEQPVAAKTPAEQPSEPSAEGKAENAEAAPEQAAPSDAAAKANEPEPASEPEPAAAEAKPESGEEGRMEPTAAEPEAGSEPAGEQPSEDAPSDRSDEPQQDGHGDGGHSSQSDPQ